MQLRTKLTCGIFKLVTGQHQSLSILMSDSSR